MRKLILSGILVFTLILTFVCVKSGMAVGPLKIYGYKDIKTQSQTTNQKMNELTKVKSEGYATTEANLQRTVKKHLEVKSTYEKVSSTKTEEQKQRAILGQDYDLSFLWVELGNYATKNNCDLTLEVSQEKDASDDENYVLCDLKFQIVSGYDGITSFIEDISKDIDLGFIPENLKLYSEYKQVKVLNDQDNSVSYDTRLMLVTEFYKTDVPISKTSISKVENEQTVAADAEAEKNATSNTTNTTNKTNTTNTANKTNTTNTSK